MLEDSPEMIKTYREYLNKKRLSQFFDLVSSTQLKKNLHQDLS